MMVELTLTDTVYQFALDFLARHWSRGGAANPTEKLLRVLIHTTYPIKETQC